MGEADAAPAEKREQRGQIREPGEDLSASFADVDVRESTAEAEGADKAGPGATRLVSAGENLCGGC